MANDSEHVELGRCLELVIDHRGKTPKKLGADWVGYGVPCISAKSINGGTLVTKDAVRYVSHEIYKRWMKEDVKREDCFLVSEGATLGECLLWEHDYPIVLGQRLFCLRANPKMLYPRYLYFYMTSPSFQSEVKARATGTSVDGLRQTEVLKLKIKLFPLAQQRQIGDTLYFLNKKIELNRRMNETLEGLARALFQSWFVDFDPVRAKASGQPPTVQQLTDSHVLLIGDGYRAKRTELGEPGLPFVRAGNLQDHGFTFDNAEILSEASVAAAGEKISQPDDVAFTSKGTVGRITLVTPKTRPFVYSPQVCFWRVLDREAIDPHVLYRWMESDEFMDQVARVKGQTDMAEYVSLRDQRQMRVALPKIEEQRRIAGSLKLIDDMVAANAAQSAQLTALRDALLPKLLSGELRVPDAGRAVESAL